MNEELVAESFLDEYTKTRIRLRDEYIKKHTLALKELAKAEIEIEKRFRKELAPYKAKKSKIRSLYRAKLKRLENKWLAENPGKELPEIKIC